jgi:hypothetical protein
MRFVDDPIEVEIRVDTQGNLHPLAFTWHGRPYPITGIGRTYTQDNNRYFLVMTLGDRIFELCWHAADNRWTVTRAPENRAMA